MHIACESEVGAVCLKSRSLSYIMIPDYLFKFWSRIYDCLPFGAIYGLTYMLVCSYAHYISTQISLSSWKKFELEFGRRKWSQKLHGDGEKLG